MTDLVAKTGGRVSEYLINTGMGNDPRAIQRALDIAKRRYGRRDSLPCCSGRKPILRDPDVLLIDLMNERGLSECAQSDLEAVYQAAGRPVTADAIFDRLYGGDADGGPSQARMYADLRDALAEPCDKLYGTSLSVAHQSRQAGWRLPMDLGGAYIAVWACNFEPFADTQASGSKARFSLVQRNVRPIAETQAGAARQALRLRCRNQHISAVQPRDMLLCRTAEAAVGLDPQQT